MRSFRPSSALALPRLSFPTSYGVRRAAIVIELAFLGFLVLGRVLGGGGAIPDARSASAPAVAVGGAAGAP